MVDQAPRLSVVIPTYNRPAQLAECLAALADSDCTRENFEVIVVDDGSPTLVDDIVDAARDHLNVQLIRQQNAGAATARNTGAGVAAAAHIAFTDDDCQPAKNWLSVFMAQIEKLPDYGFGGQTLNILDDKVCSAASQLLIDFIYSYFNAGEAQFFTSNNICVSAAGFRAMGGFDPGFPRSGGEDRDFCSRWLHAGQRLRFVPEAVIHHAHSLNLLGFTRQHFSYGRGAHSFHQRRTRRAGRPLEVEPLNFYFGLVRYPFKRFRPVRAALISLLMCWSQVVNAAGYFYEAACSRQN